EHAVFRAGRASDAGPGCITRWLPAALAGEARRIRAIADDGSTTPCGVIFEESDSVVEKLIEGIRPHPCIYDTRKLEYRRPCACQICTVNPFVSAVYEAVLLYALAINETISEGVSITNGSYITQKMWNRTFEGTCKLPTDDERRTGARSCGVRGITGTVRVNEKGDRDLDYSILDMNPETGHYHVVANYLGVRHQFVDVPNRTIHWAGGRTSPPPDVPRCGFDGSECTD
ncbi:hypothetical protein HPB47_008166, partial [Ixodes persulcatus]